MKEIPILEGEIIIKNKGEKYLETEENQIFRIGIFDWEKVKQGDRISAAVFCYNVEHHQTMGCNGIVYPGTLTILK